MKSKLIAGLLTSFMVFGGAMAVGAAKNDSRVDDSIHQEDKVISSSNVMNNHKVEVEIEHGQTIVKNKTKNRNDDGRHHGRHNGNDDSKPGDGKHKNRHSGNDDSKPGDGKHQNRHGGNDDSKPGDGKHQNRHSGDDD